MNVNHWMTVFGSAAALGSIPGTVELGMLTLGALLPARRSDLAVLGAAPRIAVVIPAHNEEASIGSCLESVFRCSRIAELASVFVIADNCTDQTAAVARASGGHVLERHNLEERGKGHALYFAFEQLLPMGFGAFLVVDADARVERNLLVDCADAFRRGVEALQCPYLVANPSHSATTRLQDLALRAFNLVRPKGRSALRCSAGILGNGFAMTRSVLEKVPYTAHSVVEDLEYHLALIAVGVRVEFLATTAVYGAMPTGEQGRSTQRARWEGGRLRMLRERGGWIFRQVLRGRLEFVEPLLDLLLLPLGYHLLLLIAGLLSSMLYPTSIAGFAILAAHLIVVIAHGESWVEDVKALLRAPGYIAWKLCQLPRIVMASSKSASWIRTARPTEEGTV